MKNVIQTYPRLFNFGLPLAIMLAMVMLVQTTFFKNNPAELSFAIILDLLLTAPLLYLAISWKNGGSKKHVIPLFLLGVLVASFIIPTEHQSYLPQIQSVLMRLVPLVEMIVFIFIIKKAVESYRTYQQNKQENTSIYETIKTVVSKTFPEPYSTVLSSEIDMFYYLLFNWNKRILQTNEFSYHKKSGAISLLSVLLCMFFLEAGIVHFLLLKWAVHPVLIWVLTFLSIYTTLQIFAAIRSMSKQPIAIKNGQLELNYGFVRTSQIALSDIQSITLSRASIGNINHAVKLSLLDDFESHNVLIYLKKPYVLKGLYGINKTYQVIALFVDEKERFVEAVQHRIH